MGLTSATRAAGQLIAYYRAGSGEHPDRDDYRRVPARLTPVRAYGLLRG